MNSPKSFRAGEHEIEKIAQKILGGMNPIAAHNAIRREYGYEPKKLHNQYLHTKVMRRLAALHRAKAGVAPTASPQDIHRVIAPSPSFASPPHPRARLKLKPDHYREMADHIRAGRKPLAALNILRTRNHWPQAAIVPHSIYVTLAKRLGVKNLSKTNLLEVRLSAAPLPTIEAAPPAGPAFDSARQTHSFAPGKLWHPSRAELEEIAQILLRSSLDVLAASNLVRKKSGWQPVSFVGTPFRKKLLSILGVESFKSKEWGELRRKHYNPQNLAPLGPRFPAPTPEVPSPSTFPESAPASPIKTEAVREPTAEEMLNYVIEFLKDKFSDNQREQELLARTAALEEKQKENDCQLKELFDLLDALTAPSATPVISATAPIAIAAPEPPPSPAPSLPKLRIAVVGLWKKQFGFLKCPDNARLIFMDSNRSPSIYNALEADCAVIARFGAHEWSEWASRKELRWEFSAGGLSSANNVIFRFAETYERNPDFFSSSQDDRVHTSSFRSHG